MTRATALVDKWTIIHAILFIAEIVVFLLMYSLSGDKEKSDDERYVSDEIPAAT
jgi:uncharacterized protein YpmB